MVAVSNGSSRPHRPLQPVCQTAAFSAPPRSVDGGHVDLSHRHHRGEGAARLVAAGGERLGQRARDDLPVYAQRSLHHPHSLSRPPLPTIAFQYRSVSSCVSVAIWNEKASVCGNAGPPFSPMQGMPQTVNWTISTSPALPDG